MKDTDWTENNQDALTEAAFDQPKITNKRSNVPDY